MAKVEPVLDFFETLGLLVRRRAVDRSIVYSYFFYWVYGYWLKAEGLLGRQRQQFPTRYGDFLWLKDELVEIEQQRAGALDDAEWASFLDEEEDL
jgi:hypothetical protein